jgi:hypothetical protein
LTCKRQNIFRFAIYTCCIFQRSDDRGEICFFRQEIRYCIWVFPVEEYYARLECEEAVPELAWRSLRSASRQTGEWLANQDGVLLIDLTPTGGEFRKRLRLFLGGWINLLK